MNRKQIIIFLTIFVVLALLFSETFIVWLKAKRLRTKAIKTLHQQERYAYEIMGMLYNTYSEDKINIFSRTYAQIRYNQNPDVFKQFNRFKNFLDDKKLTENDTD
jgi:hypothetical protein